MSNAVIRVTGVMELMGISKSQVWYLSSIGELNKIKLSPRVSVWKVSEIEAYIASKCEVA